MFCQSLSVDWLNLYVIACPCQIVFKTHIYVHIECTHTSFQKWYFAIVACFVFVHVFKKQFIFHSWYRCIYKHFTNVQKSCTERRLRTMRQRNNTMVSLWCKKSNVMPRSRVQCFMLSQTILCPILQLRNEINLTWSLSKPKENQVLNLNL